MPTTVVEEQQPAPIPPSTPRTASFRGVLKNRNFVFLWLAQLISLTVLNAANFGIIVLVNDVTHSVVMAGVAIIAFTLPAVPFSAVAGVIVDRLNKRLVLWVSNVLRMFTMLLIVVSLLNDQTNLWPLYVLIFMTSLIGQFFIPAESASIPLLVGERELMPGLSLFNITMTLSRPLVISCWEALCPISFRPLRCTWSFSRCMYNLLICCLSWWHSSILYALASFSASLLVSLRSSISASIAGTQGRKRVRPSKHCGTILWRAGILYAMIACYTLRSSSFPWWATLCC